MPRILGPYEAHLERRWSEGCRNARELWREIRAQGYPGTAKQVHRLAQPRREVPAKNTPHVHRTPKSTPPERSARRRRRRGASRATIRRTASSSGGRTRSACGLASDSRKSWGAARFRCPCLRLPIGSNPAGGSGRLSRAYRGGRQRRIRTWCRCGVRTGSHQRPIEASSVGGMNGGRIAEGPADPEIRGALFGCHERHALRRVPRGRGTSDGRAGSGNRGSPHPSRPGKAESGADCRPTRRGTRCVRP